MNRREFLRTAAVAGAAASASGHAHAVQSISKLLPPLSHLTDSAHSIPEFPPSRGGLSRSRCFRAAGRVMERIGAATSLRPARSSLSGARSRTANGQRQDSRWIQTETYGGQSARSQIIHLVGTFGNYVKIESALRIGLFEVPYASIHAADNTAISFESLPGVRFVSTPRAVFGIAALPADTHNILTLPLLSILGIAVVAMRYSGSTIVPLTWKFVVSTFADVFGCPPPTEIV